MAETCLRAVAEAVLQFLTEYAVEGLAGVGHHERGDSRQIGRTAIATTG